MPVIVHGDRWAIAQSANDAINQLLTIVKMQDRRLQTVNQTHQVTKCKCV